MPCPCCGNAAANKGFVAQELAFSTRVSFDYLECGSCGSIWIAELPAELADFYPAEYYSFTQQLQAPARGLARLLKQHRTDWALGAPDPLGWLAGRIFGQPAMLSYFRRLGLQRDSRLLDVGCGSGELLATLRNWGFSRLEGVDAFIAGDISAPGLRIRRARLEDIDERFDGLIFNHSFEHMPEPRQTLLSARERLLPGGRLLIRQPVGGCWAWRHYQANWVALDPPRHLVLPSEKGMRLLAESCGFEMLEVIYDSTARQFWASEQNMRGIGFFSAQSYRTLRRSDFFDAAQIRLWEDEARRLNAARDGDCAAYLLKML
ncbi:class I SAM-dependent methyltransferase [bacterium]|nr:class I SAM-dependent methyltransferase [bacterium]